MSWIGSAIGAVGSLLGGMNTNAANASLNQANMNWQTQMSNTAMVRRVQDLRNAGLNPLLAVGQGGASTPGFAPIPMQNPFGPGAAASAQGIQPRLQQAQLDQIAADARQKNASAALTESQTPDEPAISRSQATRMSASAVSKVDADAAVSRASLAQVQAATQNTKVDTATKQSLLDNIQNVIGKQSAEADLASLDLKTRTALYQQMLDTARKEQEAAGSSADAVAKFNQSLWGRFLNAIGPSGTSGAHAVSSAAGAAKSLAEH